MGMARRQIVYTGTWHVAPSDWPNLPTVTDQEVAAEASPYKCSFWGVRMPAFDWHVWTPDRTTVRVTISDDPEFFDRLIDSDRYLLLLVFANLLSELVRSGESRRQYGLIVDVSDDSAGQARRYHEYYLALIRSEFPGSGEPPRYVANIWRGPPPAKYR